MKTKGKRFGALPLVVVGLGAATQVTAGELQIGARWGETRLEVDGERLSSGNDVNERLTSGGFTLGYRWDEGFLLEAGTSGSSRLFEILGYNKLDHTWLAAGWQFDLNERWRLTPKIGLVQTELRSLEEDIFEGGEPVDRFKDIVPFVELNIGSRISKLFYLGAYVRQNFEDFGSSQSVGIAIGFNFQ